MQRGARARRRAQCRCESSPARSWWPPAEAARQLRLQRDDELVEPRYSIYAPVMLLLSRWSSVVGRLQTLRTTNGRPKTDLPLVVEPEFYRHFASRVIRRQRAEAINALKSPDRRLVQRRHTARLLDLDIQRVTVACYIESQINAFRLRDARVYFILQPVFGDFPLHGLYVPGKSTAEIAATSGKSKSALGASRAHGIWAADRSTLAIRNLIRLGWLRFRLPLGSAGHRLGFDLRVPVGNRNRFRFLFLNHGLRLRKTLGFRSQDISAAAAAPAFTTKAVNKHCVERDEGREGQMQSERPGQGPAQLRGFGINVDVNVNIVHVNISDGRRGYPSAA